MGKVMVVAVVLILFLSLVLVAFSAEQQVKVYLPVVPMQKWHVIREYPCNDCPPKSATAL